MYHIFIESEMKDCNKRGCFTCKGNHHSSLHAERGEKESERLLSIVHGYTYSGQCALPLIRVELKGEKLRQMFHKELYQQNGIGRMQIEACYMENN